MKQKIKCEFCGREHDFAPELMVSEKEDND